MCLWVWEGGCGCGCVHGESNSCTKTLSIMSSLFVQSVIFSHSLCGLLNKLEGVMEAPSPLFHHMPQ